MTWHNESLRHKLSSYGINTTFKKSAWSPIAFESDEVIKEFNYRDYKIWVIYEDDWNFGGAWIHHDDIILIDSISYDNLSPLAIQFILDHEIEEKELAESDPNIHNMSHSELVRKYHESANESISHRYTPEQIQRIKKDMIKYEQTVNPNEDTKEVVEYTLKGLP